MAVKENFEELINGGKIEVLKEKLQSLEIYKIDPVTNNATKSNELEVFLNTVIGYIVTEKESNAKVILKKLVKNIFCFKDSCTLILQKISKLGSKVLSTEKVWNLFNFLKNLPLPEKLNDNLFNDNYKVLENMEFDKFLDLYQSVWMVLTKKKLSGALAKSILPFLTDHRLEEFPKPELFGDFYFAYYNHGGVYSVLALNGLIKLVVKYNFEYPQFYQSVYKLTTPFILHASYAFQFLDTLNLFLSSTHIPLYIVAAFAKKLSRVLLYAPICVVRPILTILQNLMIKYEGLRKMIHNNQCINLECDPYLEDCESLKDCKALDSCLWEIKTLQSHWLPLITKKASFIDKNIGNIETPYIFKTNEDLLNILLNKKTGVKGVADDEDWTLKGSNKGLDKKFVSLKRKIIVEEDVSAKKIVMSEEPKEELLKDTFNFVVSDIFVN